MGGLPIPFFLRYAAIMSDILPQFEQEDLIGTTKHFNGNVSTSWVSVPAVAGNVIAEAFVRCAVDQLNSCRLYVSFDGGAGYILLAPGEGIGWSIKSSKESVTGITQISLKGNVAGVVYEVILNREDA